MSYDGMEASALRDLIREYYRPRITELEGLVCDSKEMLDNAAKLMAESAERRTELERLVRDLYECSREPKCCNCACFLGDDAECSMGFRKRMEKLGIEVD